MRDITKGFPGVLANDRVSFAARAGEIHALLGENGAGKSTLMSILTGLYRPDEGEIIVAGRRIELHSPRDAIRNGIGMVYQHFRLIPPFSVAENVILGLDAPRFLLNMPEIEKKVAALSESYGLRVDPKVKVWQLSVGEQQRVEIVKMLYRGARILILDEPTAVLTPQETRELFLTLRRMAGNGHAVIFITHKLHEVMEVADRITVLRGGRSVGTVEKKDTNPASLARMMVGREIPPAPSRSEGPRGEKILELQAVQAMSDKGLPALRGVSLTIRAGELLGIAGVSGNGQKELAEVVTGLRPVQAGRLYIKGKDLTNRSPKEIIEAGVSHVPEDRLGTGLIPNLGVLENVILKEYRRPPISRGPLLDRRAARERSEDLVRDFQVKVAYLDLPVKLLSGGNLQRLLLAREISAAPSLIVAVYPVRGLDIGATETVHNLLLQQKARGAAILLISEDLEEILHLSDRVAVMYEGEIQGVLPSSEARLEEIGLLMAGMKKEATTA
ncbi:MAG: ABC transporter ATP-binding protein [Firmicutes bacterium]|nr:ABC transporter ATP-binding protein [Bacillota bacterium]MCL5039192.1 ABC transporter ATP-binding protein [Bacillota bacterium]